jgi:beta-glucosidase
MSKLASNPELKGVLPANFAHGYASASYQIEGRTISGVYPLAHNLKCHLPSSAGGYDQGGRGLSIWDKVLKDQENGNDAVDSFHLWEKDVELLKQYGCKAYRFSVSWSRVKPLGESSPCPRSISAKAEST